MADNLDLVSFLVRNIADKGIYKGIDDTDKNLNSLLKSAQAVSGRNDFVSIVDKTVSETGEMYARIVVERKNLEQVKKALLDRNEKLRTDATYSISEAETMSYISGIKRNLRSAEAVRLARTSVEKAGGVLLHTPTVKSPNKYDFIIPYSGDEEELSQFKKNIFAPSDRVVRVLNKQDKIKTAEEKQALELKDIERQKKEQDKTSKENREAIEKAEAEAKKKELATQDYELKEIARQKKEQEAWNKELNKLLGSVGLDKDEADTEDKPRKSSTRALIGWYLKITGLLATIADITRRIFTVVNQQGREAIVTGMEAHSLGLSYRDVRTMKSAETRLGAQGIITGSAEDIQTMFGNLTELDEGSLEKLAVVMGSEIKDLVTAGLGSSDPMKLASLIVDAFNQRAKEGRTSVGTYVGEEQARKELNSYLARISPNLAGLFSVMQEQRTQESSIYSKEAQGSTLDFIKAISGANRGIKSDTEQSLLSEEGQLANLVKDILTQMKTALAVTLSGEAITILKKIANSRLFMSAEESLQADIRNKEINEQYISDIQGKLSALPTEQGTLSDTEWLIVQAQRNYLSNRLKKAIKENEKDINIADVSTSWTYDNYMIGKAVAKSAKEQNISALSAINNYSRVKQQAQINALKGLGFNLNEMGFTEDEIKQAEEAGSLVERALEDLESRGLGGNLRTTYNNYYESNLKRLLNKGYTKEQAQKEARLLALSGISTEKAIKTEVNRLFPEQAKEMAIRAQASTVTTQDWEKVLDKADANFGTFNVRATTIGDSTKGESRHVLYIDVNNNGKIDEFEAQLTRGYGSNVGANNEVVGSVTITPDRQVNYVNTAYSSATVKNRPLNNISSISAQ